MSVRQIKAGSTDVSVNIRIIDSTDGTPETGVVWNTAGIDMWYRRELAVSTDITEATLAALTTAHTDGGFLHINDGWYRLDLPDAAVADGVTGVQIGGTVTGMVVLAPYIELVDYDPYDAVRLGLTALPNAAADAAGGLPISDAGGLDLDAMNTNINDIETDTAVIGAAGAGLTAVPWNAAWDAEVESEANDALVALGLDHLINAAVVGADVTNNSIIAKLVSASATADWDDFVNTTDALQALRDHIGDGTNLTEAGATGNHLTAIPWNAAWDAEVESEVNDALVAIGLDHLINVAVTGPDVVDNSIIAKLVSSSATADWDDFVNTTDALQALRDHIGDGTNLAEAGGTGDHLTAIPWNASWDAEVQSEVNDALVAIGLDHLINVAVTGPDVVDNSIIAKLVSASATADWDDFVNTTDALQALRDTLALEATVAALNDLSAANVNAEVVDALATDTYAEPTGVPAATDDLATKIGYLYMALRNQVTVTATKKTFFDDGAAAEWEKDLSDDGTTYTETEANAI
jgi:hypothetical protein